MLGRQKDGGGKRPSKPGTPLINRKSPHVKKESKVQRARNKLYSQLITWKFIAMSFLIIGTIVTITVFAVIRAPIIAGFLRKYIDQIVDFWVTDESKIVTHIDSLTFETFRNRYQHRQPILFRSSMTDKTRAEIYRLLTTVYKEEILNVGHVASLTIGGHGEWKKMTVEEYINGGGNFSDDNPGYVFDLNLLPRLPEIERLIAPLVLPSASASTSSTGSRDRNGTERGSQSHDENWKADTEPSADLFKRPFEDFDDKRIFSIGNEGSGLAFHQHRQSYNDLLFGSKTWYLYKPDQLPSEGFNPWETQLKWLSEVSLPHSALLRLAIWHDCRDGVFIANCFSFLIKRLGISFSDFQ